MTINIYHQVGHQPNWNVDSYVKDGVGDGLILSPVHQTMESITKLDQSVLRNSIFDPQYYLPNSQKTKLKSYPFFPEVIADGFSTTDYSLVAIDSAKQCVDFQLEMDFESLIIPTRYIDQMISDYFDKQEAYTVIPFIKTVQQIGSSKPVYLTAALTSHMIIDEGFRERILNWITNFPEISGIYILVSFDRQTKQINSSEFLHSYLSLLNEIRSTGLEFVAGHLNTESIILSLVDEGTFSFGSFENTRIFSLDKFVQQDEERRGPKARIYLPGLLNWVQFDQAKSIMQSLPILWNHIYQESEYGNKALERPVDPHFTSPDLYKHHFQIMHLQFQELSELDTKERYQKIRQWLLNASQYYKEISDSGIALDPHGRGDHVSAWLEAIDRFASEYI